MSLPRVVLLRSVSTSPTEEEFLAQYVPLIDEEIRQDVRNFAVEAATPLAGLVQRHLILRGRACPEPLQLILFGSSPAHSSVLLDCSLETKFSERVPTDPVPPPRQSGCSIL